MLKIIIPTAILTPLTWFSKNSISYINTTTHSLLISLTNLLLNQFNTNHLNISLFFLWLLINTTTNFNNMIATSWINSYPISCIKKIINLKKLYITLLMILQLFLIITFTAIELVLFYILFKATQVQHLYYYPMR